MFWRSFFVCLWTFPHLTMAFSQTFAMKSSDVKHTKRLQELVETGMRVYLPLNYRIVRHESGLYYACVDGMSIEEICTVVTESNESVFVFLHKLDEEHAACTNRTAFETVPPEDTNGWLYTASECYPTRKGIRMPVVRSTFSMEPEPLPIRINMIAFSKNFFRGHVVTLSEI